MASHQWMLVSLASLVVAAVANGAGCGRSNDTAGAFGGGSASGGGGGDDDGIITEFEACAELSQEATLSPVNMFIAVDKSGSMDDMGKWVTTEAAFAAFFQDPSAAGLDVALRFWPDDGCDGTTCDADACATPQVALGPLSDPTHVQALTDLFAMKAPAGSTPMSAALEGAVQWARATQMTFPEEKSIVLLVTDGEPNGCVEDIAQIAAIADTAWTADGIPTFAVGLEGSFEADIDAIASAGGTTQGFFIGSANAEADLLEALKVIAGASVDCTFAVPDPAPGEVLDPKLVRIEYTEGGSSGVSQLDYDKNGDCLDGDWYYDDPAAPTTITLCPAACAQVQADGEALVEIALGCECERDSDCPSGTVCEDHHCIPACVTDADCPPEHICANGRCIPEPGDPCQNDSECPTGLVCTGGQCTLGDIFVGPEEAVQGGAFSCRLAPKRSDSLGWLLALAGAALLGWRRRS